MRKTSFLTGAATAVVLLSAPMVRAQVVGGSLAGSGQVNPDTDGLASRLQANARKGRSAADAVVGSASDTAGSAAANTSGAAAAAGDLSGEGLSGALNAGARTGVSGKPAGVDGAGSVGVSGSADRDGAGASVGASAATEAKVKN